MNLQLISKALIISNSSPTYLQTRDRGSKSCATSRTYISLEILGNLLDVISRLISVPTIPPNLLSQTILQWPTSGPPCSDANEAASFPSRAQPKRPENERRMNRLQFGADLPSGTLWRLLTFQQTERHHCWGRVVTAVNLFISLFDREDSDFRPSANS
jgi:hypothetical protein